MCDIIDVMQEHRLEIGIKQARATSFRLRAR